jgi:hypothetical protein
MEVSVKLKVPKRAEGTDRIGAPGGFYSQSGHGVEANNSASDASLHRSSGPQLHVPLDALSPVTKLKNASI